MKKIDPFYWFLRGILGKFLKSELKNEEVQFVHSNINKHRKVLWTNFVCIILVFLALRETKPSDAGTLITCLIAPVMVTGGAWFAVSFGGIPQKLVSVAMTITLWMFLAFTVSLSTMFLAVCYILPFYSWPVLALVYIGIIISCILYDTCDGLKAGLDEAQFKHSRAALLFYKKDGIRVDD